MAKKLDVVRQKYLLETKNVVAEIKHSPSQVKLILELICFTKDLSDILGFSKIYKLYCGLEKIYVSLSEKEIVYSENIESLVKSVCDAIIQCCVELESDDEEDMDISSLILYCDRAAAAEIFDADALKKNVSGKSFDFDYDEEMPDKIISVNTRNIANLLNVHEEMISRTYKISGLLMAMRANQKHLTSFQISEFNKQLLGELQILQNSLLIAHDGVLGMVKDETFFSERHQDIHGFFVFANGHKCMIPSEYIVDVTYESYINYVTEQNQLYLSRTEDEEEVLIPIYSLSSLFPGQTAVEKSSLDTIFIAEYMGQRVGIIVDRLQTSVSIVKKLLPSSFSNFKILQGICFDEKYDMIPVLYIPEILKRFRSLRGYDVKKFEAKTRPHTYRILVVDDSETTRQIESSILLSNGFMVDEAVDGINAMEMIKNQQYDLILTDDAMPRMNGEIFLDNLRHMENYAEVPVLVMAAKPIDGGNGFISKADFKRGDLIQKIRGLLHE